MYLDVVDDTPPYIWLSYNLILSSLLAVTTESLTRIQINNWEQSRKEKVQVQTPAWAFFSSFMQSLKEAHSGRRAVYTLGKCHMEVLCGWVCVYICVEGIFHMKKTRNFSGQQTEFP